MKKRIMIIAMMLAAAMASAAAASEVIVRSPGGAVEVSVTADAGGRLGYSLRFGGSRAVEFSALGVTVDGADLGLGVAPGEPERSSIDETYPTFWKHSTAINKCNVAKIPVLRAGGDTAMMIEFRVFDDGAAYRYIVPGAGERTVNGEASEWRMPAGATAWFQSNLANYEGEYVNVKIGDLHEGTQVGMPVTLDLPGGAGFAAITEGALFGYSGMNLRATGGGALTAEFSDDPEGWKMNGAFSTPWRITIVAPDLNGLFNSDIVMNVNEPPGPEFAGADWIRPGRSLWSWLNGGRTSVTPENMRFYVDVARQIGFEYLLVDEGWEDAPPEWKRPLKGWSDGLGKSNMEMMADLVEYAAERGVLIWVWKHYGMLQDPEYREKFFADLERIGAVGIKIDFMDSESKAMIGFYEDAARDASKHRLMVDFHGANKPTGEPRTYPNEMTREGVRGLEYRSLFPDHNCTLPFTRLLAGHADYTPMHFNRLWMTTSSWAHQIASAVIFSAPVTFFGAHPQDILDNPARAVIEKLPVVWDETIVLPESKIGRIAAFARRSGDVWFVAIMNAGGGRSLELPLDFAGPGGHRVTAVYDTSADPLDVKVREGVFKSGEPLPVKMRSNGGFAAIISEAD